MSQDTDRAIDRQEPTAADREDARLMENDVPEPAISDAVEAELDHYWTMILNELRSLNEHLEARL